MISVRQAMVLTGIIALVMLSLAASNVLARSGTASEDDASPVNDSAIGTIAEESTDVCEPPADDCPGAEVATRVEVVILGEVVTRGEMAMLLSRASN